MIKHIVFWKLKEGAHGQSDEANANEIKRLLESLNGKIESIEKLEVGFNFVENSNAFDVALYSEFKSKADLDAYQVHSLHVAAKVFIGEATSDRKVVDYEIS